MGSDLEQIYARVVAVRPDLAVDRLRFEPSVMWGSWYRCTFPFRPDYESYYGSQFRWLHGDEASALITVKWLEALPVGHVLAPGGEFEGKSWWSIMVKQPDLTWLRHDRDGPEPAGFYTSMFDALAEFHAPGSTKGPNDER